PQGSEESRHGRPRAAAKNRRHKMNRRNGAQRSSSARIRNLPKLLVLALALAASPAPAQVIGGWPVGMAQPIVQGPDLASTLRNAIQATSDQARLIIQSSTDIGRRARSSAYQMQNLTTDFQTLQFQFQSLRATFN